MLDVEGLAAADNRKVRCKSRWPAVLEQRRRQGSNAAEHVPKGSEQASERVLRFSGTRQSSVSMCTGIRRSWFMEASARSVALASSSEIKWHAECDVGVSRVRPRQ